MVKEPTVNITIRVPKELVESVRKIAEREDRSLNGQIARMLKAQVFDKIESPPPLDAHDDVQAA